MLNLNLWPLLVQKSYYQLGGKTLHVLGIQNNNP